MARDYRAEYINGKSKGYYRNIKTFGVNLSGSDIEAMQKIIDDLYCKNFPDFIRKILSGEITVKRD